MSKMKEIIGKGMNAIMLDCEKATMYATKNEVEGLGCIKRIQLKMHLTTCKLCRSFVEQSKIISSEVTSIKEIDENNLEVHLTEQQKENLQETVESNLESK